MSVHLGLDLGGTNIKAAVLALDDGEPRVLATATCPTESAQGPERVLERLAGHGAATLAPHGAAATVGLALPGHFDARLGTGGLLPNLHGDWDGRPIAGPVGDALGRPVALVNDVRALTLAEARLGAGRGLRDLLCVALGTGVGGGIVIDGRLVVGHGHAGEIGHVTAEPDGPLCGCGNRGCLDRVAGAARIAEEAGQPSVADAVAAARAGDARAQAALERAAEAIGRVVAGAVVLLWPRRVIVGGGVAEAGDALLEPIRAEIRRRACVLPAASFDIVPAQLGPYAGAVGATLWGAERDALVAPPR
jgi:glucokinase